MKKYLAGFLTAAAFMTLQTSPVFSNDHSNGPAAVRPSGPIALGTKLSGFSEAPSLSSPGTGQFKAVINAAHTEIRYSLTFSGTVDKVFMAHIHFGQAGVNGGISIWFCGDPTSPSPPPPTVPTTLPVCPADGGTVEGTITAADVIGPAGQGINVGEFEEVIDAILAGDTYVNVHSLTYRPGELRGQIQSRPIGSNN
jgi:hypothetical protein